MLLTHGTVPAARTLPGERGEYCSSTAGRSNAAGGSPKLRGGQHAAAAAAAGWDPEGRQAAKY